MSSEPPIEPTEILPRSSAEPSRSRAPDGRHRPVRPVRPSAGPLPALTSAAAAGVVVAGGVAAAAAFGGIKAAVGLGRMLTGAHSGRAIAPVGIVFRYSASTIVASGARLDRVDIEMRWGPQDR